ncbi:MAG TPA: DUF4124 domain-containing protein [Nevskiaceae bacterium]|nr:DUF4124 domain-containing protein [Nevskiaceae bacterium]
MKFPVMAVLLALLPIAAPAAMYRWTDASGAVHYTQTPPPAGTTGTTVAPAPPPGQVSPQLNRLSHYGQQLDQEAQKHAKEQASADDQAQARASQCAQARGRLNLQTAYAGRIFHSDEQGNRQFQSAEENAQVREQLQQQIDENCD